MKIAVPMEIGLVVSDMDCMLDFYVNLLGFELIGDAQANAQGSAKVGTTPHGYRIVRLKTPYGDRIKLVLPGGEAAQPAAPPKWVYERHGICYITFVVSDIEDIIKGLKENGVEMMSQDAVEVRPGVFCINVVDPEGNFLEFVQYADIKAYRPDLIK